MKTYKIYGYIDFEDRYKYTSCKFNAFTEEEAKRFADSYFDTVIKIEII